MIFSTPSSPLSAKQIEKNFNILNALKVVGSSSYFFPMYCEALDKASLLVPGVADTISLVGLTTHTPNVRAYILPNVSTIYGDDIAYLALQAPAQAADASSNLINVYLNTAFFDEDFNLIYSSENYNSLDVVTSYDSETGLTTIELMGLRRAKYLVFSTTCWSNTPVADPVDATITYILD